VYSFVGVISSSTTVGSLSRLSTGESPAQEAGFHLGDKILAVDGKQVKDFDQLKGYISARPGQDIAFTVERDGTRRQLTVTPVDLSKVQVAGADAPTSTEPRGFVGVGSELVSKTAANPVYAVGRAGSEFGRTITVSAKALASIFSPSGAREYANQLTEKSGKVQATGDDKRFISIYGAGRLASQAAHAGLREVLFLLILINVFVGIFNLVPLLPLDGGHVAIATYERIRSRRGRQYHADVAKLLPLTYGVVILLVAIGVTSLWLDIARPLANPFQ
jgi:membrane-associated protease RseP (regulator of RpoE activity)